MTTHALPEITEALLPEAVEAALVAARGASVLVLGMGWAAPGGGEWVRKLVPRVEIPLVLDADGLNALAGSADLLAGLPGPVVLTPHPARWPG